MKSLTNLVSAGFLSVAIASTALAGNIPTRTGNIPTVSGTTPGNIPTVSSTVPGNIPTIAAGDISTGVSLSDVLIELLSIVY